MCATAPTEVLRGLEALDHLGPEAGRLGHAGVAASPRGGFGGAVALEDVLELPDPALAPVQESLQPEPFVVYRDKNLEVAEYLLARGASIWDVFHAWTHLDTRASWMPRPRPRFEGHRPSFFDTAHNAWCHLRFILENMIGAHVIGRNRRRRWAMRAKPDRLRLQADPNS